MKKILWILLGFILLFVSLGYMSLYGTPWELYSVKKEAALYLQERYEQEMVVTDSSYSLTEGQYRVTAYPKENAELSFVVTKNKDRENGGYWFSDNFVRSLGANSVESELLPVVQRTFSENDGVLFIPYGIDPHNHAADKKKITNQELQSYQSITTNTEDGSRIDIAINRKFDSQRADEEYQKILEVVQFIKEKQYQVYQTEFHFAGDSIKFIIPTDKLPDITKKEDIRTFQE